MIAPAILVVVLAVLVGVGFWGWQDENSFVSKILNRSPAHRDIAALSAAFPQLLPPGEPSGLIFGNPYITGTGHGGRTCSAYVNTTIRNESQWEATFRAANAKWSCESADPFGTQFAFYAFPTAESAAAAVTRFEDATKDVGSGAEGTRTDDHRALYSGDRYVLTAVVSTFAHPGWERWVLVTHRSQSTSAVDIRALLKDFVGFPLD